MSSKTTITAILRKQREEGEGGGEEWGEEEEIENESIYFSGSSLVASEISEKNKRKKPKLFREC